MATSEKRTLEIRAKLVDLLTGPLGGMDGALAKWVKRAYGWFRNVAGVVLNVKTAVAGLAASILSLSTIKGFGEQADALSKLSTATGDTIANLSEVQAAFDLAGVKASEFADLTKALLGQARKAQTDSTDKLEQSFAALGITLKDLQSLGPTQLFEKMAAGLEKFGTEQEKAVALGKVLPKQFLELLPILGGGLANFQAAILEARKAGATVTEQQAKVSERLNDSLSKVGIAIGGVSRALIEEFGPDAIALFERLARSITENRQGIVDVAAAIGSGMVAAVNLAIEAVIGLVGAIESIPGVNLLDTAELDEQIRKLDESRVAVRKRIVREGGTNRSPEHLAAVKEIQDEINRLTEIRNRGLAGQLRDFKVTLSQELQAAADSVRSASNGSGYGTGRVIEGGPATVLQPPKGKAIDESDAAAVDDYLAAWGKIADKSKDLADNVDKVKPKLAFEGGFFDGFNDGAKDAIESLTSFQQLGRDASNVLASGLDGVAGAIVETSMAVDGSSQAWKRLGLSVVAELGRIITKLLIVKALQAALGYSGSVALEDGGVVEGNMGKPVQSRAFARGGVTSGPTLALFGEGRNREAFVPLPDNRSIPVTLNGAGGGTNFSFTINAVDGRDVQRMLLEQRETIMAVFAHDLKHKTEVRQMVHKAAR
ncbi:MAG: hypothetical protein JNK15_03145 [Planctomycetes bacterium]|nr:hypothetical protein [Planctomycetota bacterium]